MPEVFTEQAFQKTLNNLCPTIDNLRLMIGAARHAFNRHSVKELEGLTALQDTVTLDLDLVFEKVEIALEKRREAEKPVLLRLQDVLTQLEIMGAHIAGLAEPIRMKTKGGALFSDEDVIFVNNLFSKLTGFMRTLVDIFKYRDPVLRKYLLSESTDLIKECFAKNKDHETRMMDGFGHPQAWGIFLAILEQARLILTHLIELVKLFEN